MLTTCQFCRFLSHEQELKPLPTWLWKKLPLHGRKNRGDHGREKEEQKEEPPTCPREAWGCCMNWILESDSEEKAQRYLAPSRGLCVFGNQVNDLYIHMTNNLLTFVISILCTQCFIHINNTRGVAFFLQEMKKLRLRSKPYIPC